MKRILIGLILTMFMFASANAMTVAWDAYTDTAATGLRIESSTDQSTWSTAVNNIPVNMTATDIPNGADNTRMYYRMLAFNASETSDPSHVITFFWTTGGNGYENISPVNGIKLLDCVTIMQNSAHPDYDTCVNRYVP